MPANTAKGYPYPLGTDRVMDGDDAIHNLANAVDSKLGVAAGGSATLPAPSATNIPVSLAVTFPAGRFTVAPFVTASPTGGSPQALAPCTVVSVTAAGFTLYGARVGGGMATILCYWQAIQV
jgi:hypothetical protein